MMDAEELRRRWAVTLGQESAAAGWPNINTDATCRPVEDATVSTLSDVKTHAGQSAAGTLSAQGTFGGNDQRNASAVQLNGDLERFSLGAELGRGGMGVVYRAHQKSLRRDVAIKLVRKDVASPAAQQSFVAEALVNGLLDHPNIVPVHELGQDEQGQVFLAMKLVGGTSWKDLLHPKNDEQRAASANWSIGRHLAVLESVANAVAFANSKGILHRDLKPENVMVGEFGEVLVMDWGIAVDISDQPASGTGDARTRHRSSVTAPAGTPSYMAPEQAEGRGLDLGPWTDVYLLGAILCEILTGAPPHRGATLMSVLMAASASKPPVFPATVSSGLAAICCKALARDHTERYRTVGALQDALREQARNRASEEVATRARTTLERAQSLTASGGAVHERYSAYAEAIAGFRQALAMWAGNPTAQSDERIARLAYAAAARSAGDLGLAEVQLQGLADGSDVATERAALVTERAAQDARQRAAKRNWLLLIAAVVAIIGGSLTATLIVSQEKARTVIQRDKALDAEAKAVLSEKLAREQEQEAQRQRDTAETAKIRAQAAESDALTQRDAATREAWNARRLVAGNLSRESQPNSGAEAALALMLVQRIHPDLAPQGGISTTLLAQQLWARYTLAERAPQPEWSHTFANPVRGVRLVQDGVLVVLDEGPVEVMGGDGKTRCTLAKLESSELPGDVHWSKDAHGFIRAFSVSSTRAVHLLAKPDQDAVLRIWDLSTGGKLRTWKQPHIEAVALTNDNQHVVVANGEEGAILSVDEGREIMRFFWSKTGRWPDSRKASFAGLHVDGQLGTDEAGDECWEGRIQATFIGLPTAATEHPDEPAESRLISARLPEGSKAASADSLHSDVPAAMIDPHWGLIVDAKPLPLCLGPAPAPGLWSAIRHDAAIEVVMARGATVSSWTINGHETFVALHGESDLQYDEESTLPGLVAWPDDGTCILAMDSGLVGEGYLVQLHPDTGAIGWQMKIENAVSNLTVTADGKWLVVASTPAARSTGDRNRTVKPIVAPWLLRRQSDGRTWPLDQLVGAIPIAVRFLATTLLVTLPDGQVMHLDLAGAEPLPAVAATAAELANRDNSHAWTTAFGAPSRNSVLGLTNAGVTLAHDGRLLRAIPGLRHAWFAPDTQTLYSLRWDGKNSSLQRISLIPEHLAAELPPLRGSESRWAAWTAAEPAQAAEDGTCTPRALPAGN